MSSDEYVYVIYIATDAQTLWRALLEPEPGVEEHDDARRRHQARMSLISSGGSRRCVRRNRAAPPPSLHCLLHVPTALP